MFRRSVTVAVSTGYRAEQVEAGEMAFLSVAAPDSRRPEAESGVPGEGGLARAPRRPGLLGGAFNTLGLIHRLSGRLLRWNQMRDE